MEIMDRERKKYTPFSKQEDKFLEDNYLQFGYHELSRRMGRSKYGIVNRLRLLGLKVPANIMVTRRNLFPKGHVPFNKGIKGVHSSPATEFKKGNLPANTLYDGCITIRTDHKDRTGRQYKWIRVSLGKWLQYHLYLWEKANGKVPPGYTLRFKNKNSLDVRLNNLEIISRAQQVQDNTNHEKSAIKMKAHAAANRDLGSDKKIAFYLAPFNKPLQNEIIKNYNELLDVKREQIKLKREIKNVIRKQTTKDEGENLHVQN